MNILIALFFISDKNTNIYLDILVDYILNNLDLKDKRLLHIILLMISQGIDFSEYEEFNLYIDKNRDELFKDNYGKYILILKEKGEKKQEKGMQNWCAWACLSV